MTFIKGEFDLRPRTVGRDFLSGIIVFLVALPLCLGIAIASDADPIAGLISGVVGGIVVGIFSGSATSVSGPAAGLTAIVAAQIANLQSYEAFLLAVVLAGVIQLGFGILKAGALSAFFPSSVIKGLLAAIGVILILKQFPLMFGYSKDMGVAFGHAEAMADYEKHPHSVIDHSHPVGDILVSFYRAMAELIVHEGGFQLGAIAVGIFSILFLIAWDKIPFLKKSLVPAPLILVIVASALAWVMHFLGGNWSITQQQFVDVPKAANLGEFVGLLHHPDFSQVKNLAVYVGAITIAVVASLETLLNSEAVDKLDKKQRVSPPNRELFAQGIGNITAGLLGGIPVTSVIIRGSVNVNAGAMTKLSTIIHGCLLLACVVLIPHVLQMIPLSCLAAILVLTGYKLASPALFKQMWSEGRYQFLPFVFTLSAIVLTDLLVGISIGLVLSLLFILNSNLRSPVRRIHQKHVDGELVHIELGNQVSFLNRASLEAALRETPKGSCLVLDARRTDYIDPDVLSLIREFRDKTAPAMGFNIQLVGFREKYGIKSPEILRKYSTQEVRDNLNADRAIQILTDGNRRYVDGYPLDRALLRNIDGKFDKSNAVAVVIAGCDAQTPVELIFDVGLCDLYVVRSPAGMIESCAMGGVELGVCDGGAKLIVVLGHADQSLLTLAIRHTQSSDNQIVGHSSSNLENVFDRIADLVSQSEMACFNGLSITEKQVFFKRLAQRMVSRTAEQLLAESPIVNELVNNGQVKVVTALYDPDSGRVEFLNLDCAEEASTNNALSRSST